MGQTFSNAYSFFYEEPKKNNTEHIPDEPETNIQNEDLSTHKEALINPNEESSSNLNTPTSSVKVEHFVNNIIDKAITEVAKKTNSHLINDYKSKTSDLNFLDKQFKPTLKTIKEDGEYYYSDTDDSVMSPISDNLQIYEEENLHMYNYEISEDEDSDNSLESYPIDTKHHLECSPVNFDIYLEDDYINDFNSNVIYKDNLLQENLVLKEGMTKLQEEYDDLFFNYKRIKKIKDIDIVIKGNKIKID